MREMTLQEIQQVSFDILKDIHEFCIENDIKYSLFAGTLIGAIRHKGFIPWDDDLDIAMPRAEYKRFVESYKSPKGYELFARERQGKDVYISFGRVCEMDKTYVDTNHWPWTKTRTGIWIDVFPIDGASSDIKKAQKQSHKNQWLWRLIGWQRKSYTSIKYSKGLIGKTRWVCSKIAFGLYHGLVDRHIKLCQSVPFDEADNYSNWSWAGFGMREYYKTSAFSSYLLMPFENGEFYVMNGYDGALRAKYGDYMTLPPLEEQTPRHNESKYYWKD